MIINIAQDIERWLFLESAFDSILSNRHILQMTARHLMDNRPKTLERGQDWSEYLTTADFEAIGRYFAGL